MARKFSLIVDGAPIASGTTILLNYNDTEVESFLNSKLEPVVNEPVTNTVP